MMLSDDDWRAIQALKLKLPNKARFEIDRWIDLEARVRCSQKRPAVTRGKLERLHNVATKLSRELDCLDGNTMAALLDAGLPNVGRQDLRSTNLQKFIERPPPGIDWQPISEEALEEAHQKPERTFAPRRDAMNRLREHQEHISRIAHWLGRAAENIKAAKRGPDGEGHEWLARQCAAFLERHGAGQLSRSYKAKDEAGFTRIVLQAAARATGRKPIGSGTGAIRRVTKARDRISAAKRG